MASSLLWVAAPEPIHTMWHWRYFMKSGSHMCWHFNPFSAVWSLLSPSNNSEAAIDERPYCFLVSKTIDYCNPCTILKRLAPCVAAIINYDREQSTANVYFGEREVVKPRVNSLAKDAHKKPWNFRPNLLIRVLFYCYQQTHISILWSPDSD